MYTPQSAEFGHNDSLDGLKTFRRPMSNLVYTYEGHRCNKILEAAVEVFSGKLLDQNAERLKEIITKLHTKVFGTTYDQASYEVGYDTKDRSTILYLIRPLGLKLVEERGLDRVLSMSNRLVSSVTDRFRGAPKPQEDELVDGYSGYGLVQTWSVPYEGRKVKVLYHSTLAILDGYRKMGLGAKIIQIGNGLRQPDMIGARIQTGAMWAAMLKSRVVDRDTASPLERLYSDDLRKQAVLKRVAKKTWHPNRVDFVTGLTQAVYPEGQNQTYVSNPRYKEAYDADVRMSDLGLDSNRGDGIYVLLDVAHVSDRSKEEAMEEFIEV